MGVVGENGYVILPLQLNRSLGDGHGTLAFQTDKEFHRGMHVGAKVKIPGSVWSTALSITFWLLLAKKDILVVILGLLHIVLFLSWNKKGHVRFL